ncbi:hypothetical protein ECG_08225 [Echinococcus granulosus]|nr:hypothetical protein ECG_08225 [Echinococcus granulosus]
MRFPGTIIFLLLLALLLVAHAPSWGFAKPKAPKITQGTWQRFLSLADSILRINETIQVLPEPHYISLKLESIHPVNLQKCRHWVASNPNCPAKGSIHFECAFTSRMFDAQLLQHAINWWRRRSFLACINYPPDTWDYVRAREQAFWSVVGFFQLTYQSIVGTCPSTAACLFKLQMILASKPHANLITKFLISSANFSSHLKLPQSGHFQVRSLQTKPST